MTNRAPYGYVIYIRWTARMRPPNGDWVEYPIDWMPHWNNKVYRTETIAEEARTHITKVLGGMLKFETKLKPLYED